MSGHSWNGICPTALLPGTLEAFSLMTFATWFQGELWLAPVRVPWGCDLRPPQGACSCVNWLEERVGKLPDSVSEKVNELLHSRAKSLCCERTETVNSWWQRVCVPPIPAPPEVAEGKPFNEQGFAVTEFKCIRLSLWRNSGFGGPRISSVVFFKKPQWGAVATGSHH